MVKSYQKRISGPLHLRPDRHSHRGTAGTACALWVFEKLGSKRAGEPSETVRERVEAARVIQRERFDGTGLQTNADMGPGEIRRYCALDETSTITQRAPAA